MILLLGCTPEPYPMGGGLHRATSSGAGFSAEGVTKSVHESAAKYAKERGKVVRIENLKVIEGALARNPPSAELTFRLVDPNSAEANTEEKLISGLQKVQMIGNNPQPTQNTTSKPSIEDRLEKIKKLYLDGVISASEHDTKRKQILSDY